MPASPLLRCFPPVTNRDTRILILGSLPGEVSLAKAEYYAHPRNQFWRLAGAVAGRDIAALPYEARLEALLESGIGLWDTVAAGQRRGSLDTDIRLHRASDLKGLIATLPRLGAIAFNGGKAARIGRGEIMGACLDIDLIDLPSSSPAYTLSFERKLEAWMELRPHLLR